MATIVTRPGSQLDTRSREDLEANLQSLDQGNTYRYLLLARLAILAGDDVAAGQNLDRYANSVAIELPQSFDRLNEFTEATFRARQFSAFNTLTEIAFGVSIDIEIAPNVFGEVGVTKWQLDADRPMRFIFDEQIYQHPYLAVILKHWVHGLRMYCHFRKSNPGHLGSICISLEDMGVVPGICFSDFRKGYSLLPDPIFMGSDGYASTKATFDNSGIIWEERMSVAIWRGTTTGWFDTQGARVTDWQSLPRIQLCMLARRSDPHCDILDTGITSVGQIASAAGDDITALGIQRPFMDWREFQRFKFQIDIDGNSCAWPGLFTKLCSGSVVFKIASPVGFRQWFYDRLIPWVNYVPVSADMSDLVEKIVWLRERDDLARLIGSNGRQLTVEMTPVNETYLSERTIIRAFQHNAGFQHGEEG